MATKPKLVETPAVLDTSAQLTKLLADTAPMQRLHAFISPRLAKELIINQPAEYQRKLDRGYVALYRRAMAAQPSKWRHHQPDNILMFDNAVRMISGQHRCVAAIEANAIFGAWIIGNQPGTEVRYLDQLRPRTIGHTVQMFGHSSVIGSVTKYFLLWTVNESPLQSGRVSPDEAGEILTAYPEITEWYRQAQRIKKHDVNSTPSVPWLTYLVGRMYIESGEYAQKFAENMEYHGGEPMSALLRSTWASRKAGNSIEMKVWYHNTAARAWEGFVRGSPKKTLIAPKDRLLDWASPSR